MTDTFLFREKIKINDIKKADLIEKDIIKIMSMQ